MNANHRQRSQIIPGKVSRFLRSFAVIGVHSRLEYLVAGLIRAPARFAGLRLLAFVDIGSPKLHPQTLEQRQILSRAGGVDGERRRGDGRPLVHDLSVGQFDELTRSLFTSGSWDEIRKVVPRR
jgi:hypothetical protein